MKYAIAASLICMGLSTAALAADTTPAAMKAAPAPAAAPAGDMDAMHRAHMEHMFNELDANHDGTITREESNAYSNKKFDEADANKDGKVTKAEWDAAREAKHKEWEAKHAEFKAKHDAMKPATPATAVPEVVKK